MAADSGRYSMARPLARRRSLAGSIRICYTAAFEALLPFPPPPPPTPTSPRLCNWLGSGPVGGLRSHTRGRAAVGKLLCARLAAKRGRRRRRH
ncbi:Hypothetical predicted protein [Podarcis lilfordi]|uniref:Uncharacterized protein n=1 Tax=Podarcis lilfordi TaxID=74358 RepID=A0AA35KL18_9SAUR|nr:Hypothetical predicted protein [Podarcis lilfordi]